jgi:putative ABC transport system permease protein
MLGIVISVASVVVVVSISQGVQDQVGSQADHLGKDLITIRPGQRLNAGGLSGLGGPWASFGGQLNDSDIAVVAKTPGVTSSAPLSIVSGGIISGENKKHFDVPVIGTSSQLPVLLNQGLAFGAFFSDTPTGVDKVVIGQHIAQSLYDENVPLGQTLSVLGHQFIVVGILDDYEAAPLSPEVDLNNAVLIQYAAARAITNNNTPIYELLARAASVGQADSVAAQLNARLLTAHGGQQDFTVLKQSQVAAVTGRVLSLLTALTTGVAVISLFIGGIGIMNVMLVSVTERMHEVGVRKAVGATNRQILEQFLMEAAVLSVAGAVIGIIVAGAVILALHIATPLEPAATWQIALIAMGVSIAVGMLFGSAPALKAAQKDPIEALRNE